MTILDRALAPTPKLFKILRTAGLALLAVSGGLLGAPIALPATLVSIAGYTAVAGSILASVSQITVDSKPALPKTVKKNGK